MEIPNPANPDSDITLQSSWVQPQGLFKVHSEPLMVSLSNHERLERATFDKPVLSLPKGSE